MLGFERGFSLGGLVGAVGTGNVCCALLSCVGSALSGRYVCDAFVPPGFGAENRLFLCWKLLPLSVRCGGLFCRFVVRMVAAMQNYIAVPLVSVACAKTVCNPPHRLLYAPESPIAESAVFSQACNTTKNK